MSRALLLGLDFGSTTTRAVVASAEVLRNCVTGRMELGRAEPFFLPEAVFTPFTGDRIDVARLGTTLDGWLREAGVGGRALTTGGAIVTGLAARKQNPGAIVPLVRERAGDAVVAVAEDPRLEAWLAFHASCAPLSRAEPDRTFLHLDIGGGTTNLACAQDGEVSSTGCVFVGARHVRVAPGTYRIAEISPYGGAVLRHLGIRRGPGDDLAPADVARVVAAAVRILEGLAGGNPALLEVEWTAPLIQVPFSPPREASPTVTFSGGVGELIYRMVDGEEFPDATVYGDLGVDLARGILGSPVLARDVRSHRPLHGGRAVVVGLALHQTELSGATVHLPRSNLLPLRDLPIVARLPADASVEEFLRVVTLARGSDHGACLQVTDLAEGLEPVRAFGTRLAAALRGAAWPGDRPLVLFVPGNVGKTVGNYATEWGRIDVPLIVLDEVAVREADFAAIGSPHDQVVPVSFYGMR